MGCLCKAGYTAGLINQPDGTQISGCIDNTGTMNPWLYSCDGSTVAYSGSLATQSKGTLGNVTAPPPTTWYTDPYGNPVWSSAFWANTYAGANTTGWTQANWDTLNGNYLNDYWWLLLIVGAVIVLLVAFA